MSEPDALAIEYVIDQCERLGLRAQRVDPAPTGTGSGPRADLYASDGKHRYVIEVKTLNESDLDEAAIAERGYSSSTENLDANNSLDGVVRRAVKQIQSTPGADDAFWIAWFLVPHEHFVSMLHATLYGCRYLGDVHEPAAGRSCYFFDYASFVRHTRLTAAIVCVERGGFGLWPNPLAEGATEFRGSVLRDEWGRDGGRVADPFDDEAAGRAFVADDFSIPPSNVGAKLKSVQAKYGRPYLAPGTHMGLRSRLVIHADELVHDDEPQVV